MSRAMSLETSAMLDAAKEMVMSTTKEGSTSKTKGKTVKPDGVDFVRQAIAESAVHRVEVLACLTTSPFWWKQWRELVYDFQNDALIAKGHCGVDYRGSNGPIIPPGIYAGYEKALKVFNEIKRKQGEYKHLAALVDSGEQLMGCRIVAYDVNTGLKMPMLEWVANAADEYFVLRKCMQIAEVMMGRAGI